MSKAVARPRIAFSPDLSLVALNDKIYDIGTVNEFAASVKLPIPEDNRLVGFDENTGNADNISKSQVQFSNCSTFLNTVDTGSIEKQRSPSVEIYQVRDSECVRPCRIALPTNLDFSNLIFAQTAWHPQLPILSLVTWEWSTTTSTEDVDERVTCYMLSLEHENPQWDRAGEVFHNRVLRTFVTLGCGTTANLRVSATPFPPFRKCIASYSLCGTWVSARGPDGQLIAGPWTGKPEYLGRVSPLELPRIIEPQRAITTVLWGSHSVFLRSVIEEGCFKTRMTDPNRSVSLVLFHRLLPGYLTYVTPVVVIDDEQFQNIRLIFLPPDRAPEVVILPTTWNSIQLRCQRGLRAHAQEISHLNGTKPVIEQGANFQQMLFVQSLHRDVLRGRKAPMD